MVTTPNGPYENLIVGYDAIADWLKDHGHEADGSHREVSRAEPQAEPDAARWRIDLIAPYRPGRPAGERRPTNHMIEVEWSRRASTAGSSVTQLARHIGRGAGGLVGGTRDGVPHPAHLAGRRARQVTGGLAGLAADLLGGSGSRTCLHDRGNDA